MKVKHYLLILSGLLWSFQLLAQTVSGVVTDAGDGQPLIGASISIEGTSTGTVTDFNGEYQLSASESDVLIFSYIGYKSKSITVGNQTKIDVALDFSVEEMQEVVVIGYGIQEKRVATGSIAKIESEQLSGFNVASVTEAMDGLMSGLIVSESSGQPGAGSQIFIRGISTNGDNSPLYIVDGLQVGGIDNINPNDIESVDVLKDAASTAIYGARAANGVVIITTKRGSKDQKGQITYEAFASISNPWKIPEMLNSQQYIDLTREKFENGNQLNDLNAINFPTSADGLPNTDWMETIFAPANIMRHSLSASLDNTFISLEYWDENGTVGGDKSNFSRYAIRVNSTKEINEYVSIGQNLYLNRTENQQLPTNNAFGTPIADAFAYDPITEVYDENAQYGFAQSEWVQKEYINPLSRIFLADNDGHADQIQGNVYLEVNPLENLTFRSDFGFDIGWFKYRSFTPDNQYTPAFNNPFNSVVQGYGYNQSTQWENYLTYDLEWSEHSLNLVAGTTYINRKNDFAGGSTLSIPDAVKFDDNWQYVDAGQDTSDLSFGGAGVDYRLISYFGRAIYNYNQKYLFTATIRRDGTSNAGPANRWGVFPSFSAGWVISDEAFFPDVDISFLKLRTSWGLNGNDRIGPLGFLSTYENAFTYALGAGETLFTGGALTAPANPALSWETSQQFNIGFEMNSLNGQLSTEADFYVKDTKDLLGTNQISGYVGGNGDPVGNLGSFRNVGFEAQANYSWSVGDFNLRAGLQYSTFKNTVTEVAGSAEFQQGWNWPVRNVPITRMSEGYPVGHFIGLTSTGVFASQADIFRHVNDEGLPLQPNAEPGDLRFEDTNGDGIISNADFGNIGDPWANHIFGGSFSANWKGFDLSLVFASQLGHDIYRTYERSDVTFTNYQSFWLDRWTEDNTDAEYPRLTSSDPNRNQRPSSFYVEKGSFFRIRNIQLGYNIPTELAEKMKMQNVRVYVSGNNVLTLTNYNGFDPEIGTNGWVLDTGIDKGYYPTNRTFGAGLRFTM